MWWWDVWKFLLCHGTKPVLVPVLFKPNTPPHRTHCTPPRSQFPGPTPPCPAACDPPAILHGTGPPFVDTIPFSQQYTFCYFHAFWTGWDILPHGCSLLSYITYITPSHHTPHTGGLAQPAHPTPAAVPAAPLLRLPLAHTLYPFCPHITVLYLNPICPPPLPHYTLLPFDLFPWMDMAVTAFWFLLGCVPSCLYPLPCLHWLCPSFTLPIPSWPSCGGLVVHFLYRLLVFHSFSFFLVGCGGCGCWTFLLVVCLLLPDIQLDIMDPPTTVWWRASHHSAPQTFLVWGACSLLCSHTTMAYHAGMFTLISRVVEGGGSGRRMAGV